MVDVPDMEDIASTNKSFIVDQVRAELAAAGKDINTMSDEDLQKETQAVAQRIGTKISAKDFGPRFGISRGDKGVSIKRERPFTLAEQVRGGEREIIPPSPELGPTITQSSEIDKTMEQMYGAPGDFTEENILSSLNQAVERLQETMQVDDVVSTTYPELTQEQKDVIASAPAFQSDQKAIESTADELTQEQKQAVKDTASPELGPTIEQRGTMDDFNQRIADVSAMLPGEDNEEKRSLARRILDSILPTDVAGKMKEQFRSDEQLPRVADIFKKKKEDITIEDVFNVSESDLEGPKDLKLRPLRQAAAKLKGMGEGFREGIKLVAQQEGFTEDPYSDYGRLSVGFGTKAKSKNKKVTQLQATNDLISHVEKNVKPVIDDIQGQIDLNSNQVASLTSLIYNIGATKFKKSKAYAALLAGDTQKFLDEAFSSTKGFVKAGGKVLDGLVKRRQEEKALFETKQILREDTKLFPDKVAQATEDNQKKKIKFPSLISKAQASTVQNNIPLPKEKPEIIDVKESDEVPQVIKNFEEGNDEDKTTGLQFSAPYKLLTQSFLTKWFGGDKKTFTNEDYDDKTLEVLKTAAKNAIADGRTFVHYSDYPLNNRGVSPVALVGEYKDKDGNRFTTKYKKELEEKVNAAYGTNLIGSESKVKQLMQKLKAGKMFALDLAKDPVMKAIFSVGGFSIQKDDKGYFIQENFNFNTANKTEGTIIKKVRKLITGAGAPLKDNEGPQVTLRLGNLT